MANRLFIALCAALLLSIGAAHAAESERTLTAEVPAADLQKVSLDVAVGEVRVEPSSDNAVHIKVTLKPHESGFWFIKWQSGDKDIAAAKLRHTVQDGTLDISLAIPDEDEDNHVKAEWVVQMPARLALASDVKVGEVHITGIGGGIRAHTKVGEMVIRVPHGSVTADVKIGELEISTAATDYKSIDASSSMGDVEIHGAGGDTTDKSSGMGRHVALQGKGTDSFDLSADIGEVTLRFGEKP